MAPMKTCGRTRLGHIWWKSRLFIVAVAMAYVNSQDISSCCIKATDASCRSVCDKMSPLDQPSESVDREHRIHSIYRFCSPNLTEFWICMNQTIQDVVSGPGWWGKVCCTRGQMSLCREACANALNATGLSDCRRSDEIALFDCVEKQHVAQTCCSHTQSPNCAKACGKVLWRSGLEHVDVALKESVEENCEESPDLLRCFRELTASTVHTDTSKYLPCCQESPNLECRSTCERILRKTGDSQEISDALVPKCGSVNIQSPGIWTCFLKKDEQSKIEDVIPYDIVKLHCCYKAATINCRRLCFTTFDKGFRSNWDNFFTDCLGDPQEMALAECIEEAEAPCSLGCSGMTYCSQLNNRPTSLFRSCSAQADLDAHMAVAQKVNGFVTIAGLKLPLRNSSQCTSEVRKGVACALHVKPCTLRGHSSLVCEEDCRRVVSSCVDWSRAPPPLTAHSLCAHITPRNRTQPCVTLTDFMTPNPEPALLSAEDAVTSPCAGAPCKSSQVCRVQRNCSPGAPTSDCQRYTCVDGCPLGDGRGISVPVGSRVRVPMFRNSSGLVSRACYKICECGARGQLSRCQPLPCVTPDHCTLHDKVVQHGEKYFMECNECVCAVGEPVCSHRSCLGQTRGRDGAGRSTLLSGLPCNCPTHHLPVRTPRFRTQYPNVCLAKCAGVSDAEIEFGTRSACEAVSCGRRHVCLPARNVCLSRLQTTCPQHVCVNTSHCHMQPSLPVCDITGRTHKNPCSLVMSGQMFAYWGECLRRCSLNGIVCGIDGITYSSECAAWSEYVTVDYLGSCVAVGPISDLMEPKCQIDRIACPPLKKPNCIGFTAPGACCPKCGGALRILYSKKQIDRALYITNISTTVINLKNILSVLDRHVNIAECDLRGYLTIEMEIFVTVESILENPKDLQLKMCILEAEKLADLINRESALITSDLGLSALSYALMVHTSPTNDENSLKVSVFLLLLSYVIVYISS